MIKSNNNSLNNNCNITFILGNGFDLGLKMRTSYSHIYEDYIRTQSSSKVLNEFKNELKGRNPYDKWSDFEMGMAEYARNLSSEADLIECIRDFKDYMVEHLKKEDANIINILSNPSIRYGITEELDRSFYSFYDEFSPNVINIFKELIGEEEPELNIITFNYTNIIDRLLEIKSNYQKIDYNPPLHIHGKLNKGVAVGIDNITQFIELPYNITKKTKRAFIKPYFNNEFDTIKVSRAESIITDSSIICIYGFSMGDSDQTWVELIKKWLEADNTHQLVMFEYEDVKYGYHNYNNIMDIEDEKISLLMKKLNIDNEDLAKQIHIPIGFDIFNFNNFIKDELLDINNKYSLPKKSNNNID